jgi:hypothetical protein
MSLKSWAIIGLLTFASAVAGVFAGRVQRTSGSLPSLYVEEDKLDLGEVNESKEALFSLPISNRTQQPIEILDFETSCDCGKIYPRNLTVPAMGVAIITVELDLTNRSASSLLNNS